ncbi:adenosylcobinamide-phosphate synthase CbiB [Reichenbachiella versicolor]|uniref:adenosylcobinamide-phosphate synthase CbiB n=1 Tax=Reichenbachiella versicolor TaxID=1821036 RepID=UPI000D6E1E5A|nr:adenosylcobinamide-phosphate synthase CbiB [Reichenbachiella versicolor]
MNQVYILFIAFVFDAILGDPRWLPHLIVLFGNSISSGEKVLNKGEKRFIKGMVLTLALVISSFIIPYYLLAQLRGINYWISDIVSIVLLFYCLANRTLINEGRAVFKTLKGEGVEAGRKRLSWIVGRDTSNLNEQQIRTATLETMSENLSDGVIAPLFYYFVLGIPGAVAYKMINTLDSMIGYKSERYVDFGKFAAKLDDIANYLPSRLTSFLMLIVARKTNGLPFVIREGKKHASPNAGYPEAALAYILNCQFGGPNVYHGKVIEKPYIGNNPRLLVDADLKTAEYVNWFSTILSCVLFGIVFYMLQS